MTPIDLDLTAASLFYKIKNSFKITPCGTRWIRTSGHFINHFKRNQAHHPYMEDMENGTNREAGTNADGIETQRLELDMRVANKVLHHCSKNQLIYTGARGRHQEPVNRRASTAPHSHPDRPEEQSIR